ncbi:aminotransferase class V-fold PLP-dependent enzyme [Faecalibaculum rodentium]|uniref:aminotransferase class V-fold PLP-dependent enzyme n=1 Tax=Faecalibaculum rodentium TaxID=1702221 RepID=UPI0026EEDFEF|nr:aminotransferase class V-fold PLP-dependent enzyme [Faecalibaculum rodentium]
MKTYPLESIDLETAKNFQFRMTDAITKAFTGKESLTRGDLGVVPGLNKPVSTWKAEQAIAEFFDAEAAMLVRGSGTGAIRYALFSALKPGQTLLVHKAPVYSTTETSIRMLGLKTVEADFNEPDDIRRVMKAHPEIRTALVQYTRQVPEDRYDMAQVVKTIKECADIPVVTDDNYAVMKVRNIGTQCGADLSCFSTFKLQGPEGIGCIVGKKNFIDALVKEHYSGGSQTQGWEAMEVLRGLVNAPVALAVQAQVTDTLADRIRQLPGIRDAFVANAQSKVLIAEFEKPVARQVLQEAEKLGALPNPVGAESKYELAPMFYRVSGTFRKEDPGREERMIRINPNRSGPQTILRILEQAMAACSG